MLWGWAEPLAAFGFQVALTFSLTLASADLVNRNEIVLAVTEVSGARTGAGVGRRRPLKRKQKRRRRQRRLRRRKRRQGGRAGAGESGAGP